MKTFKSVLFLFLLSTLIISCSNDDDAGDSGTTGGGGEAFSAKIDGADFAASTNPATLIGGTFTTTNGTSLLTGQGSTNNGDFINFSIIDFNGPGTYTTGDNISNTNQIQYGELVGQTANVWASNLASASVGGLQAGEITITSQDDNGAEGTFSFEGYNAADMSTKMISEGQFKISFDN
ncbi:DUF6252 family protein [Aureisphaera galaxeae]|uniref:DUF6252 family protein n=1 Tax=Aureisphaera galaxeae TaxID=1538023 RepID=UPI002350AD17|nr:DUF6252 family protein [Aureisphaera galaxeae]MDC8003129.1 DUF6252 family protein [Aureisphaera galaxeae]